MAISPELPSTDEVQADGEAAPTRKRRRRRRGRRGSRENGSLPLSEMTAAGDEVDADEEKSGVEIPTAEPAKLNLLDAPHLSASAIIPNAPSEPVWSFAPHDHRPAEPVPAKETADMFTTEPREIEEPARIEPDPEPPKPAAPAGPPRKGWWQRPFRGR